MLESEKKKRIFKITFYCFLLENNVYKLLKKYIEVKFYVTVLLFNEDFFFFHLNFCAFGKFEAVVLNPI